MESDEEAILANAKHALSAVLLFALLGVLVYSNTLHVPFYLDDIHNIEGNSAVRIDSASPSALWRAMAQSPIKSRPVAYLSFALNYLFHGSALPGYHLVNILVHVLSAIFLFLFLLKTEMLAGLTDERQGFPVVAFWATLLWLVHPLQTQAVTYTVQRMNSMAAMFYILSLLLYVTGRTSVGARIRILCFIGSCLAGLAALGSKEIAATLPFMLFLYEWFFFQQLDRAWLKRKMPLVLCLIFFVALLAFFLLGSKPVTAILSGYCWRDFTLSERLLTEPRVVLFYMSLLFFPHPSRLTLDHDFAISKSLLVPPSTVAAIIAIIVLLAIALWLARRQRLLSFCILWFLINLLIESSVIGLEIMFEHRLYLPSMFFFVFITVVILRVAKFHKGIHFVFAIVVAILCFWTYERNAVWTDRVVFWTDCVSKSSQKSRPYNNLGLALYEEGRLDESIPNLEEAVRLDPTNVDALYNLGNVMLKKGRFQDAIENYSAALKLSPGDPDIHNNIGYALQALGRFVDAAYHYRFALRIDPGHRNARYNLTRLSAWLNQKK